MPQSCWVELLLFVSNGTIPNFSVRQEDKQQEPCGALLFHLLKNAISLDQSSLFKLSFSSLSVRSSPPFSMETCLTLTLWLAHTITRQTLCLTIQIIMALRKGWQRGKTDGGTAFSYRLCPLATFWKCIKEIQCLHTYHIDAVLLSLHHRTGRKTSTDHVKIFCIIYFQYVYWHEINIKSG